ncbi:MAG: T9SS type A sorting domain-containing protein [Chitinophagales bacterium]
MRGNSIDWYTQSSGGSLLGSAASGAGLTVNPTTGGAFYAASRSAAGCVSSTRKATGVISILSLPAAPTAPASQSVCSDTAYTFVFDSVLAGSGGNQIEWSRYSGFDSSTVVSSGNDIYFTVNAGETDTLWLRSRTSATGCVSGGVFTTGKVNMRPEAPTAPAPQSVCDDTTYNFTYLSLQAGDNGNQVVWSLNSNFGSSTVINNGEDINVLVEENSVDTVWLKSKNDTTGCLSSHVSTTVTNVNCVEIAEEVYEEMVEDSFDYNYFKIVHKIDSILDEAGLILCRDGEQEFFNEYQKWKQYWRLMVNADGSFDPYARALAQQINLVPNNCSNDYEWNNIGVDASPDQAANLVFAVWAEPKANPIQNPPQKILIGTGGGLWKTEDGCQNWMYVPFVDNNTGNTFTFVGISSIAVDPSDLNKIWVGTRNNFNAGYDFFSLGVFYSTDGGETWTRDDNLNTQLRIAPGLTGTYPGVLQEHVRVAISPNTHIVYALAGDKLFRRESNGNWTKIFQHSNAGISFRGINFVPDLASNEHDAIFINTFFGSANGNDEVWRIIDDLSSTLPTANIYQINVPLTNLTNTSNYMVSIPTKSRFYLLANNVIGTNNKEIFAEVNNTNYLTLGDNLSLSHHVTFPVTFSFQPANSNVGLQKFEVSRSMATNGEAVMYYGNLELWKSINDGVNWTKVGNYNGDFANGQETHGDIRSMLMYWSDDAYDNGINDIVLAGSDGGLCVKRPNATIFSEFENANGTGLVIGSYRSVAASELDYKTIGVGMSHNGVFVYRNQNTTDYVWNRVVNQSDNGVARYDDWKNPNSSNPNNSHHLLFESSDGTVILMDYRGNFGFGPNQDLDVPTGITPSTATTSARYHYHPIVVHPTTQEFYVGYNEILKVKHNSSAPYLSYDQTAVTTCGKDYNITDDYILSFDINVSNPTGDVLTMVYNHQNACNSGHEKVVIRKKSDGTYSDLTLGNGFPECWSPAYVLTNPDNADEIWVSMGGYYRNNNDELVDGLERVFYSCDAGQNWVDRSEGLPDLPILSMVYHKGSNDKIYAGTYGGVYEWMPDYGSHNCNGGATAGYWQCFNKDLPIAPVLDLQINYCGQKLRTSLQEMGLWETDLPPLPPYTLTADEEWNTARKQHASVIIPDGITLTVTGSSTEINMARGTTITVEPGGKLIVDDGATITNTCGAMWDGIIVKGNKLLPQDLSTNDDNTAVSQNQGFVYLHNAHIKNAYEALRVWNPADGWVDESFGYQGGTGGIVRAVGSEFVNNRRSVEFMYYKNWQGGIEMPNLSYFKNCQFNTDNEHSDEHPFSAHATMWGTSGVKFEGCSFENNDTRTTNPHNLGTGIGSIDASYTVKEFPYVTQNSNSIKSTFKNLYTGVLVENGTSDIPVYIYNSEFTDNQAGVIMSNSNQSAVNGNLFTVGHLELSDGPAGHFIGVAVDNSTGFQHIGNEFNSDNGIDAPFAAIGSLLFNTGEADNETNANIYHNISFATLTNLVNRSSPDTFGASGLTGLRFFCNHNDNQTQQLDYTVYQDFVTPNHGIAHAQNSIDLASGQTISAADIFSSPNNATLPNEHHYMNRSYFDVNQYYYTAPQTPQLNNVTAAGMVNPVQAQRDRFCPSLDPDGGCIACSLTPTNITEMKADFDTAYWAYSDELTQLNAMIDGGNTALLKHKIDTATAGASALKDSLLAKSPYLSEAVLEAVVKRKGFFTSTQIYNILYANPDALQSELFMQQVQDSINADYANLLRARRGDTTTRTAHEMLNSTYSQEYHRLNSSILINMFHDTSGYSHAEYRHWLGKLKHPEADMAVIDDYFETGIADTALMLLDSIPVRYNLTAYQDTSYKVFKELTLFKAALRTDSISVSHLDSSQVEQLDAIAQKGDLPSARKAQGILHFFYNYPYRTTPQIPDMGYSLKRDATEQAEPETEKIKQPPVAEPYLKVYPNPAKNEVTFSFNTGCQNEDIGLLVIADLQGRVMLNEVVPQTATERLVDCKQWQNGLYLYRLICGDKVVGSGKLAIIK